MKRIALVIILLLGLSWAISTISMKDDLAKDKDYPKPKCDKECVPESFGWHEIAGRNKDGTSRWAERMKCPVTEEFFWRSGSEGIPPWRKKVDSI